MPGDLMPLMEQPNLGWWTKGVNGGVIAGYLHGLLDNGPWRRHWLNHLRSGKECPRPAIDRPHHASHRDQLLDRLADSFEQHVYFSQLLGT